MLAQLVKYDVHTTRKINSIHAIFYHILSLYSLLYSDSLRVTFSVLQQCRECIWWMQIELNVKTVADLIVSKYVLYTVC